MRSLAALPVPLLAMLPIHVMAQNAPAAPELGSGLLQMALGFGVVLALLIGSLWLLKRISTPHGTAGQLLKVVSAVGVGPRERVVIVEVEEKWLVLGVAPGRVTALHELPRRELANSPPLPEFAAKLKILLDRGNAR